MTTCLQVTMSLHTPLSLDEGGNPGFAFGRQYVHAMGMSDEIEGRDLEIVTIPDVLGMNGEVLVSLARATRIRSPIATSVDRRVPREFDCPICDRVGHANGSVLSLDNIRPFNPILHLVVSPVKPWKHS